MTNQIANIVLQDSDFPLLTPTVLNQQYLEKDGDIMPISRLAQLKVALDSLQPVPPNATTVWFDNTILLQDSSGTGDSNTINETSMTFSGTTATVSVSNSSISSNVDYSIKTATKKLSLGDPTVVGGGTSLIIDDTNYQMSVLTNDYNGKFVVNSGLAYRVIDIATTPTNHIVPNYNYYVSDGIDPYVYPRKTYSTTGVSTYNDGFTFYITNVSSSAITVTSDDGLYFYAFLTVPSPTFKMAGYLTCQFTLVYVSGDYLWAIK